MEQLYAAYTRAEEVRMMTRIVGEEDLSEADRSYLNFGERLERFFISQDVTEDRSIEKSLEIGWQMLGSLSKEELTRLSAELLERYASLMNTEQDP
ncbi:ATP synthase beta subunit C-terminal domain-containing protein [Dongshaea marina]|uniref:ATP synthase beta subunit C-terminal domain-containing protein n=1 Tax=Dongshaea marina TaxID=2047966 RepID=UPI0038994659